MILSINVSGQILATAKQGVPQKIEFKGATLVLENNIAIRFKVLQSYLTNEEYSEIFLKVVFNGTTYIIKDYTAKDGVMSLDFKNINPKYMNDDVIATICGIRNGEEYEGETITYSIVTYAKNMIGTTNPELKTLLVDMLNYGAATQIYSKYRVDSLANAWLNAEQQACGTQYDRTPETCFNINYETIDNVAASFIGMRLSLNEAVMLRFVAQMDDVMGVSAEISVDGVKKIIPSIEFKAHATTPNAYVVDFAGLNASQFGKEVYIRLVKDGVAISNTASYSVESYIASMYDSKDEALVALLKSLLKYGDSVCAYIDRVNQSESSLETEMASITWENISNAKKITSQYTLVTPYDSEWDYAHHPFIIKFKDKLYAMWSSGHDAEDNVGQRVLMSSSTTGFNWSTPSAFVDTKRGVNSDIVSYALGFYTNGEILVGYYHSFEYDISCLRENGTFRPEGNGIHTNSGNYLRYTYDGVTWSEPVAMNYYRSLTAPPELTSDGKLIMMGGTNYIYTYDTTGISGWTAGDMASSVTKELVANGTIKTLTEAHLYEMKDNTLRAMFRTNTDYLWCAKSWDYGLTWTAPYKTNLTDDHSKFVFGKLPDGRYYYVGNPIRGGGRLPLMLSVSNDGNVFNKSYILRNEKYIIKSAGLYKNGNYAYPSVCVDEEYMYIIYSKGKEVIELTRIALSGI